MFFNMNYFLISGANSKQGVWKFNPDWASKTDIRYQVEAEA